MRERYKFFISRLQRIDGSHDNRPRLNCGTNACKKKVNLNRTLITKTHNYLRRHVMRQCNSALITKAVLSLYKNSLHTNHPHHFGPRYNQFSVYFNTISSFSSTSTNVSSVTPTLVLASFKPVNSHPTLSILKWAADRACW